MQRTSTHLMTIAMTVALMFTLSGFETVSAKTVDQGNVTSVKVTIDLPVGEISLSGGAEKLVNVSIKEDGEDAAEPNLQYSTQGEQGILVIQPSGGDAMGEDYEWNVQLNNSIPMELNLTLGATDSELKLGTLSLNTLNITTGVGETVLDLQGAWKQDLNASITTGVGEVMVKLPEEIGVIVNTGGVVVDFDMGGLEWDKDAKAYVNDVYGDSDVTLRLNIKTGVGDIVFE